MVTLKEWWAQGAFIEIDRYRIFTRIQGAGPMLVFLHGFPTSSHDWCEVFEDLARDYRCVAFDYLGYGASDKPQDADYSSIEQTKRALKILERLGVGKAVVIGHDLGGILLQQLLHQAVEGSAALVIEQAIFSNSSVYPELYRPTPTQLALVDPVQGKHLAQQINQPRLEALLAAMFPQKPPPSEHIEDLWKAISLNDGQLLWPQQLVYMQERADLGAAWVEAMRKTESALSFIYGLADPISGTQILSRAKADLPSADCIGLQGLGHYPQIESAVDYIAALRSTLAKRAGGE